MSLLATKKGKQRDRYRVKKAVITVKKREKREQQLYTNRIPAGMDRRIIDKILQIMIS